MFVSWDCPFCEQGGVATGSTVEKAKENAHKQQDAHRLVCPGDRNIKEKET